jgi:hypothetical protein
MMALPEIVRSGKYSDFTLVCGEYRFLLHQAIVCPQSSVISAALEGKFQEASSKVLEVHDFEVFTVQEMISFLYSKDYDIRASHTVSQDSLNTVNISKDDSSETSIEEEGDSILGALHSHLQVNAIADYYDIKSLVSMANSKILPLLQDCEAPDVVLRFAQQVSSTTGHAALHSMVISTLAENLEDVIGLQEFKDIDLGSNFSKGVLQVCAERLCRLQHEITTLRSLLAEEERKKMWITNKVDDCLDTVKKTS